MKLDDLPMAAGTTAHAQAPQPPRPAAAASPAGDDAWHDLLDRATAPYRAAGRFAWHFARGKLGRDPVFRGLLERGDLSINGVTGAAGGARVIDIGCGQGLMASLLQGCADIAAAGRWPREWPAAPAATSYLGIELMPRDVARARASTAGLALAPSFECIDMRRAVLPPAEIVVILDVLHYVDHAAQQALLTRVRDSLLQGGGQGGRDALGPRRLVLRVGDAASPRGFAMSQWVDRTVALVRGHSVPPTWGRTLDEWIALLRELGFTVQPVPMSRGTPFANVMLVADVVGRA
jgi:SAM-dependent methyltransferase